MNFLAKKKKEKVYILSCEHIMIISGFLGFAYPKVIAKAYIVLPGSKGIGYHHCTLTHHTHADVNRTYHVYIHGSRLAIRKCFLHMRRIDMDIRNITQWGQPVIAYNLVQLSVKKVMRAVGKDIVITVFPSPCQQQFFGQFIGKTFCMHLTSPSCSLLFLQHSSLCSTPDYL